MPNYLITMKEITTNSERDIYLWLPVGKNGHKKRFKPQPIKQTRFQRVKEGILGLWKKP